MDRFRWYDWLVVGLTADVTSAIIVAMITGSFGAMMLIPLVVLSWLSYENLRGSNYNDEEPD